MIPDKADSSARPAELQPEPALPKANDWTLREKLHGEKELLGFYVTGHPLDSYEEKIAELATHDSSTLEGLEKGDGSGALRNDDRHPEAPQSRRKSLGFAGD